jgi:hypothetical protein
MSTQGVGLSARSRRTWLLPLAAALLAAGVWAGIGLVRHAREAHARRVSGAVHFCMTSLTAVGAALDLYRSEHEGAWPHSVDDLVPNYLRQTGDCAREEVGGKHCQYTPPADDAPDAAVVIRCTRTPGVVVVLRKDSEVVVEGTDGW